MGEKDKSGREEKEKGERRKSKVEVKQKIPTETKFSNIINVSWISTGLREFWEEANVLKIAARALCKQYCLRRTKDDELYCVGKLKNRSPK
ncbi:MAG: hypothetical protein Q7T72_15015, partial [Bacteroidales bacterium]|nr:hypothetical protein [Bacteroidales bacterium]